MDDDAKPTRQQISDAVDGLGWRLILGAVQTHVLVPSLVSAAAVATVCAAAVVWGVPLPPAGDVAGNIGRSVTNRKKMAVVAEPRGKPAVTR